MRPLLISCLTVAGLAAALPAAAASRAPAAATVTIVIPAFPAASVVAAIKKALGSMPNVRIVNPNKVTEPSAPPGVLQFAPGEVNRLTRAQIGQIVSLYPATLPKGRKGHLIVLQLQQYSVPSISVVQADTKAFTLHTGERVVLVRSNYGWARVLPYNGPKLTHRQQ